MNPISAAERVLVLRLLHSQIGEALDQARADLAVHMDPGDRQSAALRTASGDRVKLGAVSLTDPKPRLRVHDREAWARWVAAEHPTEVEEVVEVRVRPAAEKAILAALEESGEIPPGTDYVAGSPVLQGRAEPDAPARLGEYLAEHRLTLAELIAEPPAVAS